MLMTNYRLRLQPHNLRYTAQLPPGFDLDTPGVREAAPLAFVQAEVEAHLAAGGTLPTDEYADLVIYAMPFTDPDLKMLAAVDILFSGYEDDGTLLLDVLLWLVLYQEAWAQRWQ